METFHLHVESLILAQDER